jgi:hypothetical protein
MSTVKFNFHANCATIADHQSADKRIPTNLKVWATYLRQQVAKSSVKAQSIFRVTWYQTSTWS